VRTAFITCTTALLLIMGLFGVPWYLILSWLLAFGAGYVYNSGRPLYV
jgi:hypothetical protein